MTSDDIARMLDRLTDRVDRIENSGDEQEAEVATFFESSDSVVVRDDGVVRGADLRRLLYNDGVYQATTWGGDAVGENVLDSNETSFGTDAVDIPGEQRQTTTATDVDAVSGSDVTPLHWNQTTYNTAVYE